MTETQVTEITVLKDINLPAPQTVVDALKAEFEKRYEIAREEIKEFKPDLSTGKGRKAIASLAYKISRTKTGLDKAAEAVVADQSKIVKAVNAERKTMKETLDGMRDDVNKPLDDWKEKEAAREAFVKDAFTALDIDTTSMDSEAIQALLEDVAERKYDPDVFLDWHTPIENRRSEVIQTLNKAFEDRLQFEADQEELAELRRDKEARAEADRIAEVEAEEKRLADEQVEQDKAESEEAQNEADEKANMGSIAELMPSDKPAVSEAFPGALTPVTIVDHNPMSDEQETDFMDDIVADLMDIGASLDSARLIYDAIANNEIRHVSITY